MSTEERRVFWREFIQTLRWQFTRAMWEVWFSGLRPERIRGSILFVSVRTNYEQDWIQHRLMTPIQRTARDLSRDILPTMITEVQIEVREEH